ncbi:ribosome biogenesis GTPase Der, partial [candidate division WOR-3 bacterium]
MTVAIVGRPNVGKSTIFNRLVGRRLSIVHPTPGVTRDRVFAYAEWRGKIFGLFDTGGFWPDKKILFEEVVDSIRRAVEESDLVLLVIDGKIGATPLDQELYRFLRRMGKRIIIVVNKLDRPGEVIYDLPFPEPSFMVSAIHGHGFYELLEEMTKGIEVKKEEKPEHLRLLILGRPNVGKSTLLNRLLGRKRAVVEPTPGTTRDPLSDFFEFRGEKIELIDTAGIRRRSRIRGAIEFYSVLRALKLIPQSDISFLLFDSVEGPVRQDLRLAELVLLRGKGLVVVPNKIDLIPADRLNQLVVETRRY